MLQVSFDRHSLWIGGERKLILSGAFHYFRLPHPSLWEKRLQLFKEAGLNTVDIYIPWNYHSRARGEYDFTEERNIEKVFQLCDTLGLYVIARAGPYCCAEMYAGGFPPWLLREKTVLRCQRHGAFQYDPRYVDLALEWYDVVLPKIAKCQNLILFQIENEYQFLPFVKPPLLWFVNAVRRRDPLLLMKLLNHGKLKKSLIDLSRKLPTESAESRNRYFQELYQKAREHFSVPIFHNDVASFGPRMLDVDLMAIDDYALTAFDDPFANQELFCSLDVMEEGLEKIGRVQPLFIAEFQGGWFDTWGGLGYAHIRKKLGVRQLDIALKSAFAQGTTLCNIYMFCGGTTWGYFQSPDVYTSYDFAAPISECGLKTRRFEAVKKIFAFMARHQRTFCTSTWNRKASQSVRGRGLFYRVREEGGTSFHFRRNMRSEEADIAGVRIPPKAMAISVEERGRLIETLGPLAIPPVKRVLPKNALPRLYPFEAKLFREYLSPDYDDSRWESFSTATPITFVETETDVGFLWVRAKVQGARELEIDARHLFTLYSNGKRMFSYDNFSNPIAVGDDLARTVTLTLPEEPKEPQLTLLIASLGQNKDFEEDAENPRGLISLKADKKPLTVKVRGGLFGEKEELTPKHFSPPPLRSDGERSPKFSLPHLTKESEGVLIYTTSFFLEKIPHPIQLEMDALGFGNIYLNGVLIGRFWSPKGPQKRFYLPEGICRQGINELTFALWKRGTWGGLRRAALAWARI